MNAICMMPAMAKDGKNSCKNACIAHGLLKSMGIQIKTSLVSLEIMVPAYKVTCRIDSQGECIVDAATVTPMKPPPAPPVEDQDDGEVEPPKKKQKGCKGKSKGRGGKGRGRACGK